MKDALEYISKKRASDPWYKRPVGITSFIFIAAILVTMLFVHFAYK